MKKGMKKVYSCLAVIMCCVMVGCGEDRTYEYEAWTQKNHVMQDIMQEWYIWGETLQERGWKDYFGTTSDFFKKLIAASHPSDTWSYCSIDSLHKDYHERGNFNHLDSYGMDYTTMSDPTRLTSQTYARILTVYDGSPAKECGLERGEFIGYIDGEKVTDKNVVQLKSGASLNLTVQKLSVIGDSLIWQSEREVVMGSSRKVDDTQVPVCNVFVKGDKVIGYIMINHLNGDGFKEYLKEFESADVLIVDLRLCNDGTPEGASALASCMVDQTKYDEVFCKSVWRDSKKELNQTFKYDSSMKAYNAGIKNLYFITSTYTAGAAEWVIYGLRHTMGKDLIKTAGVKSKGQNVAIREFPTNFGYTLGLSVAYVTDGDGNYDYGSGIDSDLSVDEFQYVRLYPYGNRNEVVLRTIIDSL